jgi:hypothetical protein
MRGTTTDDPSINFADANVQGFQAKKLSKEERDKRTANNECFYCGHAGHFARECHSHPAGRGRGRGQSRGQSRFNKPVRTRVTKIREEEPSENPDTMDATVVSRIYHDQENHFKVLCHRMGHRLSYRALTAALWLEGEENGREERGSS